jgi:hypothetical protein
VDKFINISTPGKASAMMLQQLLKSRIKWIWLTFKFFCLYQLAFLYWQNRESGSPYLLK